MTELLSAWVFFIWLSSGTPDNPIGPFPTAEACEATRVLAPAHILATSPCLEVKPLPTKREQT